MLTYESNLAQESGLSLGLRHGTRPLSPTSHLHLVTAHELEDLKQALARGHVPADFDAKLKKLGSGGLLHRSIEQNCRTMIALLRAAHEGSFKEATAQECERLLRVLAYVRKDDDAIADYRPDGFTDDQGEVRAVTSQFNHVLERFKGWRLRHQVPAMWQQAALYP